MLGGGSNDGTTMRVSLYSDSFATSEITDTLVVHPSRDLWRHWIDTNPDEPRLFVRIWLDADRSFISAVGDPVQSEMVDCLFVPMWMIDAHQIEGCGELYDTAVISASSLPKATRIVVRPIDSAFLGVDVVGVLEKAFSRIGVLQQGTTVLIRLEELGGFQVGVYIHKLEPAEEVYLDGDEIPLEFEEAVDHVEVPVPTAPIATAPVEPFPDSMIPLEPVASVWGTGNRLGMKEG
jgi:hypothetical protein